MKLPATITIPGLAAVLDEFLSPDAATAGDGVEIRQDKAGTTVSACEGRHAATIRTPAGGSLEPILLDPAALAGGCPGQDLKLYRMTETAGVVAQGTGELVTVTIRPGPLARSARDMADVVEGELASGMTRTVFELDPRHLLAAAKALVATGAETMTVAIAPRWNVLACMAETKQVSATFLVAGETFAAPAPGPDATLAGGDPLEFVIEKRTGTSARPAAQRSPTAKCGIPAHEIPW